MPGKHGRRLQALKRRAKFLSERIEANKTKDLSYDKSELSALRYAIEELEKGINSGKPNRAEGSRAASR